MKFSQAIILLAATSQVGASSVSDEPEQEKCCVDACTAKGETKYFSIDTRFDLCGETCMKPFWFPVYHLFEKGLTRADEGDENPCLTLGYPKYLETVTHGAFGLYSTLDLYDHADVEFNINLDKQHVEVGDDCTVEYKIDGETCGELCLSSTVAPFAEKFGGVTKGNFKDLGYSKLDHTEQVNMGPFGSADVNVYTKDEVLKFVHDAILGDCTIEYKIDGETCGELCLSSTVAPFAEQFGGVTKGNCADQGFSTFDHEESVDMGPFGKATVTVYTK